MAPFPSVVLICLAFGLLFVPPAFIAGYAVAKRRVSLRFIFVAVAVEAVALGLLCWIRAYA